MEDSSFLEAANELYSKRRHAQCVAACRSALQATPELVDVRLLLARALMALRRDQEAQVEVAAAMRDRAQCPEGYTLLGELAFRRDEMRAADIFLREALRLAPRDEYTRQLHSLVQSRITPASAGAKLPAATAEAGTFSPRSRAPASRLARGTQGVPVHRDDGPTETEVPIIEAEGSELPTVEEHHEQPTAPMARAAPAAGRGRDARSGSHAAPAAGRGRDARSGSHAAPAAQPPRRWLVPKTDAGEPTVNASRAESVALKLNPGQIGFGEYLVASGILTRWQLYCALQLQDGKHLRLGDAVVRLGFADAPTIERAARRYHAAANSGEPRAVA